MYTVFNYTPKISVLACKWTAVKIVTSYLVDWFGVQAKMQKCDGNVFLNVSLIYLEFMNDEM